MYGLCWFCSATTAPAPGCHTTGRAEQNRVQRLWLCNTGKTSKEITKVPVDSGMLVPLLAGCFSFSLCTLLGTPSSEVVGVRYPLLLMLVINKDEELLLMQKVTKLFLIRKFRAFSNINRDWLCWLGCTEKEPSNELCNNNKTVRGWVV